MTAANFDGGSTHTIQDSKLKCLKVKRPIFILSVQDIHLLSQMFDRHTTNCVAGSTNPNHRKGISFFFKKNVYTTNICII